MWVGWSIVINLRVYSEEAGRGGGYEVYEMILSYGQKDKCCMACSRKLKDGEMAAFERTVSKSFPPFKLPCSNLGFLGLVLVWVCVFVGQGPDAKVQP